MRAAAVAQPRPGVSYRNGTAQETRLPATSADVVLAVQALHWMEPAPTFMEIARLLRPGGVFAAADADWPPVMASAAAERAWVEVERRIGVFEDRIVRAGALHDALAPAPRSVATSDVAPPPEIQARGGGVHSWKKAGHLARMAGSGLFSFVRELVFFEPVGTGTQGTDAERFVALMRSQGSYQQLHLAGVGDDELGMDDLERAVADDLARGQGTEYGLLGLSWRVRIGVMA